MDFNLFSFDEEIESSETKISARKIRLREKLTAKSFLKKEKASEVLTSLPKEGYADHIRSNGSFDYFSLIPICIELMGGAVDEFWFATWTMNAGNVKEMFQLFDAGKIKNITALVGLYFQKRESAVFNTLYEGLKERKQRLFSNENHAKISILTNSKFNIVIEGSANFTANPRIKQFTILNSKELAEFDKQWMNELFD